MELWFWFAIGGAVLGGIPSFLLKVASKREYNSELFILYGGGVSVLLVLPFAIGFAGVYLLTWPLILLSTSIGMLASIGGIFRLYALYHIDTTIYFPLVKVLSPFLAIVFGIAFFSESFTPQEWVGLIAGVLVPLLLITQHEKLRQNNLSKGLVLVLFTGVLSAIVAALHKFAVDQFASVLWVFCFSVFGVFIGSVFVITYKEGYRRLFSYIRNDTSPYLLLWATTRAVFLTASFGLILYAYAFGGTLAIVHTIHSLYILIPIVLSVIFYNEHWNTQKAIAIALSLVALALLE